MKLLTYFFYGSFLCISINAQICPYPLRMDFNNDCAVDFLDFAIFCEEWLDSGLDLEVELESAQSNVNSAINLYVTDHSGLLPGAGDVPFVEALTGTTDPNGNTGTDYGPYLDSIPYNPYLNLNTVDINGIPGDYSHGWHFDTTTGNFNPDHNIIFEEAIFKLDRLRRAIRYYKDDHMGNSPTLPNLHAQMTLYTDAEGNTASVKDEVYIYGPYLQIVPTNPMNDSNTVAAVDVSCVGWPYDETTGDIYVGVADLNVADPNDNELLQKFIEAGATLP